MKSRILILLLCFFAISGINFAFAETTSFKNGMITEPEGTFYYENDIKFIPESHGVYEKEGKYYYFDDTGAIKTVTEPGICAIDENSYYFYEDNSIKTVTSNGYKKIDGVYTR